MVRYLPYNPSSTVRVEESLEVVDGKIFLRHIPKEGSIFIDGFTETDSLSPEPNQFSCQYSLFTFYRDANRVLNFNAEHNGQTLDISYIAVGTVFTAEDANEIKAHMENQGTDTLSGRQCLCYRIGRVINHLVDVFDGVGQIVEVLCPEPRCKHCKCKKK